MKRNRKEKALPEQAALQWIYVAVLSMMALTGFGQMPIFKRYYIADIPGLGWLAHFYTTHFIHYLGATALLCLITYTAVAYFLSLKERYAVSVGGIVRIAFLAAVVVTGIVRALKNLPDVTFSPGFTMFTDIAHLAFMFGLMLSALALRVAGVGWLRSRK